MKQGELVMLRNINEGFVISDEGYKVKLSRQHLSYIESDGHAVTFEIENILNPYTLVVYLSGKEHHWHLPYNLKKLDTFAEQIKVKWQRI
mgnify:CR=1 FL=1